MGRQIERIVIVAFDLSFFVTEETAVYGESARKIELRFTVVGERTLLA